jgi:hypothetical protein
MYLNDGLNAGNEFQFSRKSWAWNDKVLTNEMGELKISFMLALEKYVL